MAEEPNWDSKVSLADRYISLHNLNIIVVRGFDLMDDNIEKIHDLAVGQIQLNSFAWQAEDDEIYRRLGCQLGQHRARN